MNAASQDMIKSERANNLHQQQEQKASGLHDINAESIKDLKRHHDKEMAEFLDGHGRAGSAEDARDKAAQILDSSQKQSIAMLENAHSEAAKELKKANVRAASDLKAAHDESADKQHEKDQVISWMSGGYSLNRNQSE